MIPISIPKEQIENLRKVLYTYKMELSIITYDSNSAQTKRLSGVDELPQNLSGDKISWINISGLKDTVAIKHLCELFNIHPLSVEDILHTKLQPKMEIFDKYKFLSLKTIQQEKKFQHKTGIIKKRERKTKIKEFLIDHISIIFTKSVLITFQEISSDPFEGIRKKILEDIGEIRKMGTDYLAYSIIDAVVDEYFLTLNHLEVDIEKFEDRALQTRDDFFINEIQDTKKYLLHIKRAISPLKENMLIISHHESFFQAAELKPFLQDLNEHLSHAVTMVENHHEWLSNIMDVNLSVLSQQMNKVMKVLAMISTIFIPLSFVAAIYGMNFYHMPIFSHQFGHHIVFGVMGAIAVIMIIFFKIRRWF